jgi:hypothetical protein
MIYIIDRNGKVISSANGPVNEDDLATRGEMAVVSDLVLPLERAAVSGFPDQPAIVESAPPAQAKIILTTTAKDTDGDGLPEILADGQSQAQITAQLLDADGKPVKGAPVVQFRTTAGALSQRSVPCSKGKASVQLRANLDTVAVTVSAFADGFQGARLQLEFVPPA